VVTMDQEKEGPGPGGGKELQQKPRCVRDYGPGLGIGSQGPVMPAARGRGHLHTKNEPHEVGNQPLSSRSG